MSKILVPVAWPYANGPRHIGHVAGFGVPSDVYARYMRMHGDDVLMISGTDEHGTPILVQAENEGISAQELADRYNRVIVEDLVKLGLSYDIFTRTTTGNHYTVVQEVFKQLHKNGYMVAKMQMSAVDANTGRTLPDRYIEGTCPLCGYEGARGDQCDDCGNQLDPIDLINPRSKIDGKPPKFIESEQFFLDLPALRDELRKWLETKQDWRPNVLKFSLGLLDDIQPRAMTRDIDWGIPVPLPDWEDNPTKRLYVWFDAVVGYLSASIEWGRRFGEEHINDCKHNDGPADITPEELWRNWWNNPASESNYFMGKDNITFHSQIWPAELLGYRGIGEKGGEIGKYGELQLPTEVVSSEFLSMEGKKFSSSRGVVIYVKDFLSRYQPDALRYYIAAAGPENQDTDFTWADFVQRNNSELVAGWGNLVNRVANMIAKNFGKIPIPGELEEIDTILLDNIEAGFDSVGKLIATHHQHAAIAEAMRLVAEANKYVSETEPFKLKDDVLGSAEATNLRLATILHTLAQVITDLNTILAPFLPYAANKIDEIYGGNGKVAPLPRIEEVTDLDIPERTYPIITGDYTLGETIREWKRHVIVAGVPITKPDPVFIKLDPSVVDEEIARLTGEAQE